MLFKNLLFMGKQLFYIIIKLKNKEYDKKA